MALKLSKALSNFDLADYVDLDCGSFDIKIRQAAMHNDRFKAAVTKRAIAAKKKSVVPTDISSITGTIEQDVELFIDTVFVGWGDRPLMDDDGTPVDFTPENLRELFLGQGKEGRVLFMKIQQSAIDDQAFMIREDDIKN